MLDGIIPIYPPLRHCIKLMEKTIHCEWMAVPSSLGRASNVPVFQSCVLLYNINLTLVGWTNVLYLVVAGVSTFLFCNLLFLLTNNSYFSYQSLSRSCVIKFASLDVLLVWQQNMNYGNKNTLSIANTANVACGFRCEWNQLMINSSDIILIS